MIWKTHVILADYATLVIRKDDEAYYTVFGPADLSGKGNQQIRKMMCDEISAYLNGGERPDWLDEMTRSKEESIQHENGSEIIATGPYEAGCPRQDYEAQYSRARLIDKLYGFKKKPLLAKI